METKSQPGLSVSIERFDDVPFEQHGTATEQLHLKHHVNPSSLTDMSVDFWKKLRIWSEQVAADPQAPFERRFTIITTAQAPAGSAVVLHGIDIFRPQTGKVETASADEIACWFVDTDYFGESFFVRQAYFPGADVPYKQLKTSLKAEVDEDAWESLKRTTSRAFPRPKGGRVAVKVINHLSDEVMKVLRVANVL